MIKYISFVAAALIAFIFLANHFIQGTSSSQELATQRPLNVLSSTADIEDKFISIDEPLLVSHDSPPHEILENSTQTITPESPKAAYREQPELTELQDFSTNLPLALTGEKIGQKVYLNETDEMAISFTHEDISRLAPHLGLLVSNASPALAYRDGHLRGIEIGQVQENSVLHNFGFEMGDIITHINGSKINDPFEIVLALRNLRSNQLQIEIDRNSSVESLQFILPD